MKDKPVKIHTTNIFGEPYVFEARIVGEKTHGFNTPLGGWALYGGGEGDTPAEFYLYIPKGKRKVRRMNKKSIIQIEWPN